MQSYNAWKLKNVPTVNAQDSFVTSSKIVPENSTECKKQNYSDFQYAYPGKANVSNCSILKKQVRFERPTQPTTTVVMKSPNFSALLKNSKEKNHLQTKELDLSLRDGNVIRKVPQDSLKSKKGEYRKTNEELFEKSTLNSDNIRKFALLDNVLQEEQNVRQIPDKVTDKNDFSDKIDLTYKPRSKVLSECTNLKPVNIEESTECKCKCQNGSKNKENENCKTKEMDPTVAELINIVKMQNEQLRILQNQVEMLIKINDNNSRNDEIKETLADVGRKERVKKNERMRYDTRNKTKKYHERSNGKNVALYEEQTYGNGYNEEVRKITKENYLTKQIKNDKISVGIMTSFQVSLTSPFERTKLPRNRYESEESTSTNADSYDYKNIKPQEEKREIRHRKHITNNQNKPIKVFTDTWHDKNNFVDKHCLEINNTNKDNDYSLQDIDLERSLEVQEPPLSPNHTVHVEMQDYDSDSDDETSSADPGWTFYDNILGKVNNILENSPAPSEKYEKLRQPCDYTIDEIKEQAIQNLRDKGIGIDGKFNPNEISFAVKQLLMKYMSDEELANFTKKNEIGRTQRTDKEFHRTRNHNAKILDITTLKKQPKLL